MLVLNQSNSYTFANTVVQVTDNTAYTATAASDVTAIPKFNMLIPVVMTKGVTNTMELYQPGDSAAFISAHGTPNPSKYGFGPDFIADVLSRSASGVGIYTINLRDTDAYMANMILCMKYKVESDVAYCDTEGNAYYVDSTGDISTTATDGTPVVRDVLHVKHELVSIEKCTSRFELSTAMNNLYSATEDADGYKTIPWFAINYRGCTSYGNNAYFNLASKTSDFDGSMTFSVNMYDGENSSSTGYNFSMDIAAGESINANYYFEQQFNSNFSTMWFTSSDHIDEIKELFTTYLYSVDDFVADTMDYHTQGFININPFDCNTFGITMDEGTVDTTVTRAFTLANGTDGTADRDTLFQKFYKGEIIGDLTSVLRYQFNYIPDIGYDTDTKSNIVTLVNNRFQTTVTTVMLGGTDGIQSALVDHFANYTDSNPSIRQIAAAQSASMYNPYSRRTLTYPASYFDTISMVDRFAVWANYYQPFAGSACRWSGFIEDTMYYPEETVEIMNGLTEARINVVMKDQNSGAYLADQLMNTTYLSDQTEFNNALIITNMITDLVRLAHDNHYTFNEDVQVGLFNEAVDEVINGKYNKYAANMTTSVKRVGTTGMEKSANIITVTIDFCDISKYTTIDIVLVDE